MLQVRRPYLLHLVVVMETVLAVLVAVLPLQVR